MSETRKWKMPMLDGGPTLNVLADNQFGARESFTTNWNDRIAEDLQQFKGKIVGHANAGDCIEWYKGDPEDQLYLDFRKEVMKDGLPYLECAGNHDLCTYAGPFSRTADQWAKVMGRPTANKVTRMGDIAVIALNPDFWKYDFSIPGYAPPPPISESSMRWLSEQLDLLGSTPTWIMTHHIPPGQMPRFDLDWEQLVQPRVNLFEIIASHGNVIGWISGHWHTAVTNVADQLNVINAGGRKIFGVNAPASSGLTPGDNFDYHRWTQSARSMFVTYQGDHIDVRWRDHTLSGWHEPQGKAMHQLTIK